MFPGSPAARRALLPDRQAALWKSGVMSLLKRGDYSQTPWTQEPPDYLAQRCGLGDSGGLRTTVADPLSKSFLVPELMP